MMYGRIYQRLTNARLLTPLYQDIFIFFAAHDSALAMRK